MGQGGECERLCDVPGDPEHRDVFLGCGGPAHLDHGAIDFGHGGDAEAGESIQERRPVGGDHGGGPEGDGVPGRDRRVEMVMQRRI